MTSPLVRLWLAQRLPDWCDHAYAIWRGILHALGISTEWDPCELDKFYTDLPGPATAPTQGRAGEFHTLIPCPVCHAGVGKDCITADNHVTGPHKARREAAARQDATS